jgi:hypothetical protein
MVPFSSCSGFYNVLGGITSLLASFAQSISEKKGSFLIWLRLGRFFGSLCKILVRNFLASPDRYFGSFRLPRSIF